MSNSESLPVFFKALQDENVPEKDKIQSGKAVLKQFLNYQFYRFEQGDPVSELIKERATFIDQFLKKIWQAFMPENAATLIAVGGYGRGELHPYSDIDLLIIVDEMGAYPSQISRFITFLWDLGFDIGQAVRTVEDCELAGLEDVTTATNLLESRWITGDYSRYEALQQLWNKTTFFWPSGNFFKAKFAEQEQRRTQFNDTIYQLEPNVKESPGGLRDIQTIYWVAKRHFNANSINELVQHHFLSTEEFMQIEAAHKYLNRVRFALQHKRKRRENRLQFDLQQSIAKSFGYQDNEDKQAVEQFMNSYFRNVHNVVKYNEILLQHFREILFDDDDSEVSYVNQNFKRVNDYLELTHSQVFEQNPTAIFEAFIILESMPELKGLRSGMIRSIQNNLHKIDDNFRFNPVNKALFLEIFRQPNGVNAAVKRLHKYGVLGSYLPVFKKITGLMQFDMFHAYTVDDHTILVIRNLRRFFIEEYTFEFPTAHQVAKELCKPEVLFLAGLFHDIAKGRRGAHEVLGARDARQFSEEHNLSKKDGKMISWLVRHHLDFSAVAQKKDISDPEILQEFAKLVKDQEHLDYLYLLTLADVCATSEEIWNDWKNSLFLELYNETSKVLATDINSPKNKRKKALLTQEKSKEILNKRGTKAFQYNDLWNSFAESKLFSKIAPDHLARITKQLISCDPSADNILFQEQTPKGASELIIYMPDRDYLFAHIAHALDLSCTDVVEANIFSSSNHKTLVIIYFLQRDTHDYIDTTRSQEIIATIKEQLKNEEVEPLSQGLIGKHRRSRYFNTPTEIKFNQLNSHFTELSINTKDSPGLLARIGCALKTENIRLHDAKIHTVGEKAEDVFLISNTENKGILSKQRQTQLIKALTQMIEN